MPLSDSELHAFLSSSRNGTRITCRVQPRASRTALAGVMGGALKIALTAPPVDGKANAALCEFLAELFHRPKSSISVVSGQTGRNKIIEISDLSLQEAAAILRNQ